MSKALQVYLLNPADLPPETIAVTFAKTSRSPLSFREIARELTDEKSAEFHEKWVVGYGHASVAEHAILHIAVENISRLAIEEIESNRLASYTEKSTRYQKWGAEDFYVPDEIKNGSLQEAYVETCQTLFSTYREAIPIIENLVKSELPQQEGESIKAWENRIRTEYIDVCRYLLPAASLANVGVTINARALEHAIQKMLSHPLLEVQNVARQIKSIAIEQIPTLVKYANHVPYLQQTRQYFTQLSKQIPSSSNSSDIDDCSLIRYDVEGEERILAAALFKYSQFSFAQCEQYVHNLSFSEKTTLASYLLEKLDAYDIPLRELEHCAFTFEVILDQGAYFELKRHRMMTITTQPLTTHLGYETPSRIVRAGFTDAYQKAMQKASVIYELIEKSFPIAASYLVPNAFKRRVLLTLNLRSLDHLLRLRSAPNAHFAIRKMAQRMASLVREKCPIFGQFLRCNPAETWQEIDQAHFQR